MSIIEGLQQKKLSREQEMDMLSEEERLMNRQYNAMDAQVAPIVREAPPAPVSNFIKELPRQAPIAPVVPKSNMQLMQRQWESFMNQTQPGYRGR